MCDVCLGMWFLDSKMYDKLAGKSESCAVNEEKLRMIRWCPKNVKVMRSSIGAERDVCLYLKAPRAVLPPPAMGLGVRDFMQGFYGFWGPIDLWFNPGLNAPVRGFNIQACNSSKLLSFLRVQNPLRTRHRISRRTSFREHLPKSCPKPPP